MKYGVFPGDNGHFALIICLPNGEHQLREAIKSGEQFDSICMTIPGLRPWISPSQATPTTAPFGIGQIHAVWRDYVHENGPQLLNFFAVGDSAIRTNPLYGRGCSTGTLHAHKHAEVRYCRHLRGVGHAISLAPCKLKFLFFEEIIIAINLIKGGSLFFSLKKSSFCRSLSELFLINSLSVTSLGFNV